MLALCSPIKAQKFNAVACFYEKTTVLPNVDMLEIHYCEKLSARRKHVKCR